MACSRRSRPGLNRCLGMRVLITGAGGNLGTELRHHLRGRYDLLLTSRSGRPNTDIQAADLTDWDEAWVRLFGGVGNATPFRGSRPVSGRTAPITTTPVGLEFAIIVATGTLHNLDVRCQLTLIYFRMKDIAILLVDLLSTVTALWLRWHRGHHCRRPHPQAAAAGLQFSWLLTVSRTSSFAACAAVPARHRPVPLTNWRRRQRVAPGARMPG